MALHVTVQEKALQGGVLATSHGVTWPGWEIQVRALLTSQMGLSQPTDPIVVGVS